MSQNKRNRAQELLNKTHEALSRKFGNSTETAENDGHSHTYSKDDNFTSFNGAGKHRHAVAPGASKTGPAVYLDGSTKDKHTHDLEQPIESDREMPELPSSV